MRRVRDFFRGLVPNFLKGEKKFTSLKERNTQTNLRLTVRAFDQKPYKQLLERLEKFVDKKLIARKAESIEVQEQLLTNVCAALYSLISEKKPQLFGVVTHRDGKKSFVNSPENQQIFVNIAGTVLLKGINNYALEQFLKSPRCNNLEYLLELVSEARNRRELN